MREPGKYEWRIDNTPANVRRACETSLCMADDVAELDKLFPAEKVVGARYPEAGMAGIE